jgi:hypothetical protein
MKKSSPVCWHTGSGLDILKTKRNGECHSEVLKISELHAPSLCKCRVSFLIDASPVDKERNKFNVEYIRGVSFLQ